MTELLTSAQMRAIEQAAIESGEVTGLELMERAGRGVVEAIFEEWPELAKTSHRAVVLCGPGNNGGDGFVVARLLKEWGWEVEVFLYGEPEKLPPDARVNYERWRELGEVSPLALNAFRAPHPQYGSEFADIYVDALFGTGLSRALAGEAEKVVRHLCGYGGEDYTSRTVAIDAPSGLCMDSGRVLVSEPDPAIAEFQKIAGNAEIQKFAGKAQKPAIPNIRRFARLTVAFDSPKAGHFLNDGPSMSGKCVIKDIGLEKRRVVQSDLADSNSAKTKRKLIGLTRRVYLKLLCKELLVPDVRETELQHWCFGWAKESGSSHKYTHGHALILSGGLGKTGAARLAARGALRIGAGLVTVGSPGEALAENAAQLTAIMLRGVEDSTALAETLKDDRINALCLGPGLGLDRARDLVPVGLAGKGRAVVLDADALTAFADEPEELFSLLHNNCVLTPHAGEFARLFPDIAEKLNAPATKGPAYSKVDATRAAAKRAGCVVLFKGADTVIAAPDGRCSINAALYDRAAPWLATAGSGDVLAGFITGLLARGFGSMQAAETAAWLHVECALKFGPGLIAEDLPEQLPKVFRDLGL